ncbi:alpha/beta hydrolase [Streptomyces sp. NBC_01373]|uniref:alpha/beta hydrolase n=1 Tax=Streptomyces sp. NBC_01373 TaxID=2903843 RepID=UPI0022533203|nr:alpha/beta hydrolase [Streptomyces sp. NBC_01373]MCX4706399.1 alpha/beta hydrolase [Streptomyces sp. NBC_01373]
MNRRSLYRRVRTPLSLMATAGVAAALLATSVAPASAGKGSSSPSRKPTVVLVHGAFADSTSWNGVVKKLKRDGYPVVAAANPLRGLSSDSAYLRDVLAAIDGPVVLAGHSYGGAVISSAAHGADNVKALVYIAAFMPDKGESAIELAGKYPGSTLGEALRPVPITMPDGSQGADLYIQQDKFHHQFAADVPESTTDIMAVAQRPVTGAALEEGAGEPAWKTIPSWVLVATEDLNIPPRRLRPSWPSGPRPTPWKCGHRTP